MSPVLIPEGKFKVIVGSQNGETDKIRWVITKQKILFHAVWRSSKSSTSFPVSSKMYVFSFILTW